MKRLTTHAEPLPAGFKLDSVKIEGEYIVAKYMRFYKSEVLANHNYEEYYTIYFNRDGDQILAVEDTIEKGI